MNRDLRSVATTLAAVDISKFGTRQDARTQLHLRHQMYTLISEACRITRVPWTDCYREDRGDGALFIAPPTVAAEQLLDPFAHHLVAVLRRYNRLASQTARLRLRLAVHTGQVHRDDHGVTGPALVHLFRLLDAPAFKKAAADIGADLAMIVSGRLYSDVTENDALIDPAAYKPQRIICKETRTQAWIWTPPAH
ncbi:nucleotidyl cyclase domain-containing protein [Actinomadura formosensis]|uniref:hypothetical protein n=1 Tax=Actinomadura formosensis TaxID=60706 RepID=UPI000833A9E1|nr:hypothetical protein [Actinomadura formosensis]